MNAKIMSLLLQWQHMALIISNRDIDFVGLRNRIVGKWTELGITLRNLGYNVPISLSEFFEINGI